MTEIKKKSFKKLSILFWAIFVLGAVAVVILFNLVAGGKFGELPSYEELENPKSALASEVFSSDLQVMGYYFRKNRSVVDFDDLSPFLVNALVATEDARYEEHSGIDGRALARVLIKTLFMGDTGAGGGSTISQQLAKNLFPRNHGQLLATKLKEWVVAVQLEKRYTKEEIIAMYFNTVEYGNNSFGIKAAAKTYFDTIPRDLRIEQAAILVGLLKATTKYNPLRNPENATNRRNTVLAQMMKYEYITEAEFDSLKVLPLGIRNKPSTHISGLAPYLREYLRTMMTAKEPDPDRYKNPDSYKAAKARWDNDPLYGWCNKNFKSDGTPYDIYTDGLKIYTTINSKMQRYAEESVKDHLSKYLQGKFNNELKKNKNRPFAHDLSKADREKIIETNIRRSDRYAYLKRTYNLPHDSIVEIFNKPVQTKLFSWNGDIDTVISPLDSILYTKAFLHAGFMAMEPLTGQVRAYVGGINYEYFKYDHVLVAKRQVGSTFKPFIYTLFVEDNNSPCQLVANVPVSFELPTGQVYTPGFSKSKFDDQMITVKRGLAFSLNQVSAWILKHYSPEAVIDEARKFGIKSHIDPYPSICVGAAEITLAEMVSAYCVFPNKGVYTSPVLVTHIADKNGNVISKFRPTEIKEAISKEDAYVMLDMMRGVVTEGTSTALIHKYKLTNEISGKTGTTNNNSDGWFIGIIPDLVAGGWVGGEERSIHFRSTLYGQGASMALPIYGMFMQKVYADSTLGYSKLPFEKPDNLPFELNCATANKPVEDDIF